METDCVYNLRENLHKLSEEVAILAEDLSVRDRNGSGEETVKLMKDYIQRISEEMAILDNREDEGE